MDQQLYAQLHHPDAARQDQRGIWLGKDFISDQCFQVAKDAYSSDCEDDPKGCQTCDEALDVARYEALGEANSDERAVVIALFRQFEAESTVNILGSCTKQIVPSVY